MNLLCSKMRSFGLLVAGHVAYPLKSVDQHLVVRGQQVSELCLASNLNRLLAISTTLDKLIKLHVLHHKVRIITFAWSDFDDWTRQKTFPVKSTPILVLQRSPVGLMFFPS